MEITKNIPTLEEAFASLPDDFTPSEQTKKDFTFWYEREIKNIEDYAATAKGEAVATMFPCRVAKGYSTQYIFEFAVYDRALPQTNAINWHGQNTSQWLYAGCILIGEDGRVSTHH